MRKNKKIATMTWIHNYNYGSILQAFALQKFLISEGYKNEIIDYNPSKLTKVVNLFKNHNSLKLFYYKLKEYIANRKSKKVGHDITKKHTKFDEFIKFKLIKTKEYRNCKQLKKLQGKFDIYICGSDQIWNPELLNPPFYFSYLNDNDKRIAYGPSFGVAEIKDKWKKNKIKSYLNKFSHISVREQNGKTILKDLNLNNKQISVVLDPTLLLNANEWEELTNNNNENNNNKKYLLCYFLKENPIYWESARYIAKNLGLKILIIPNCEDSYNQDEEIMDEVGPNEFISLIKNADFMLTDSFHGTIFSIMFHIDFCVYKRFEDNSKESQNSRIENILKKVNLEGRIYNKNQIIKKCDTIKNYEYIDKILANEKEKSIQYLKYSIEN